MAQKELMVAWLNDAHAMETALIPMLEKHAKAASDDPAARQRIELHAEQTRRHAELVRGCIERLGAKPSAAKQSLGSMFGTLQSVSTGMFSDQLVKNAILDYAVEHFEIACYDALITAASELGDTHIGEVCREILRDEQEMADWLHSQTPAIVRKALVQQHKPAR